jgi:riboflavin transporter FmnP
VRSGSYHGSPEAVWGIFHTYMMSWIKIGLALLLAVLTYLVFARNHQRERYNHVRMMARIAIFGAISAILYVVPVFQIHLPFLPEFLAVHFDEIPAFIAGFAYGPVAAVGVILIKTLIKLPFSSTLCVGELADFLFSSAFVIPSALIYRKKRNLKGVALGFAVSTVIQLIVSLVLNVYAMLPFYMFVMGFPSEAIRGMSIAAIKVVNASWGDWAIWGESTWIWGYGLLAVLPLNIIKDICVIIGTFLIYRSIHNFLHFEK